MCFVLAAFYICICIHYECVYLFLRFSRSCSLALSFRPGIFSKHFQCCMYTNMYTQRWNDSHLQRVSFFMKISGMIVMFAGRICIYALMCTCATVLLMRQCPLRMLHPQNPRHLPNQAHSDPSVSRGTN